jgi:hypothetical protein
MKNGWVLRESENSDFNTQFFVFRTVAMEIETTFA